MITEITGNWIGKFTSGKSNNKSTQFYLECKETNGKVLGFLTDDDTKEVFEAPARVKGTFSSNQIKFGITYPYDFSEDEEGKLHFDKDKEAIEVKCIGLLIDETFTGTWKITTAEMDKLGRISYQDFEGTWYMKKN